MTQMNDNFAKLPGNYLFSEVARRRNQYTASHPEHPLINMGIGDVTLPLFPSVIRAMHQAVDEMAAADTFRGYAPEQGYEFLRSVIAKCDYQDRGVNISEEEIFVSDGAKSDCSNILDIFGPDNIVALCDPVYPVYLDSNAMSGRAGDYDAATGKWTKIVYLPCTAENHFLPELPKQKVDMIYLCFPNNPTGTSASRSELAKWVEYANKNGSVILFDSAYEAFITTPEVPHSIFEIPGAETCAIEFRSFSKTAGFTGNRCAYTVVPKTLVRDGQNLRDMWFRRQCSKFNGVPYVVQRGAEAVYTPQGQAELKETIAYYQTNARIMREVLTKAGKRFFGGVDSPYLWIQTPEGMSSWDTFDLLLTQENVVTTPGVGFGQCGEGFFRVTSFNTPENTRIAVERIVTVL